MTSFRKVKTDDNLKIIANWIYHTDNIFFDRLFDNEDNAISSIKKLIQSKYVNPYHRKFFTIVYDEKNPDIVMGIAVSYKASQISHSETYMAFNEVGMTLSKLTFINLFNCLFTSYIRRNDYYLANLYVNPDYRNKSYGSKLVEKVKQAARQSNSNNLLVDIVYSKKDLIAFFEKFGFQKNFKKYTKVIGSNYGYYSMKYKLK